jgi:hypothetical protein
MNKNAITDNIFFRFEEDFVEENIRCIPMIVRFKLDACGIKLKLAEWSKMDPQDREHLAVAACESPEEIADYRDKLVRLIFERTGNTATPIPVPDSPAWSRTDEIPYTIGEKLRESSLHLPLAAWQQLTTLQRFALLKLSYPGHENKNFPRAMAEFGFSAVGSDDRRVN